MTLSHKVLFGLTAGLFATAILPQPTVALQGTNSASSISADFPFESRFVAVLGSRMHYVDEGQGEPLLFLPVNSTYSYLCSKIIPFSSDT